MPRYSPHFLRDVRWYLAIRHRFTFCGKSIEVETRRDGVDGLRAFHDMDSRGRSAPTRHPRFLRTLLRVKASVNLHVKMYAEDIAAGYLMHRELVECAATLSAPSWFLEAVERQAERARPVAASSGPGDWVRLIPARREG